MIKPRWNRKLFRTFKNNNKSSSRRKDLTHCDSWTTRSVEKKIGARFRNARSIERKGKRQSFGTLVIQRDFFLLLLPPSRQPVSPLHPLFGTVCPFLWAASKLCPLPSSRSMQLVNRFFEGSALSSFDSRPTFFVVKKKTKKKGSLNFLKHIITFILIIDRLS